MGVLLDNTVTELNSWVAKDKSAEGENQFSLEKMESTLGELKNIFKQKENLVEGLQCSNMLQRFCQILTSSKSTMLHYLYLPTSHRPLHQIKKRLKSLIANEQARQLNINERRLKL